MATLSTTARNAGADAVGNLADAGAGPGTIKIYTGSSPGPDSAVTGTLLAEFTLSDPAFGAAATGVKTLDITPAVEDTSANATGTAGYARLADSVPATVMDLTVTATGGGGDIELNSVSINAGVVVTITSGTITMPAS
jgi:hypothetical protein